MWMGYLADHYGDTSSLRHGFADGGASLEVRWAKLAYSLVWPDEIRVRV